MLALLAAAVTAVALSSAPVSADEPAAKALQKKELRLKLKQAIAKKQAESKKPAETVEAKPVTPTAKPTPKPTAKPVAVLPTAELVRKIDALLESKLAADHLTASPQASDAEFLRRVSLDLTGVIPTAEAARKFLDDKDVEKRAKLIDELLARPEYGQRLADVWMPKLFPKDSENRFVLREPLSKWLAEEFAGNTPWDEFAAKLITATGTVEENPAVTFYLANRSVDKLTDAVGTHLLGQSVACAQCHNHPFTALKQTEYWGLAAFFSKVSVPRPMNLNKGGDNTKLGVTEGNVRSRGKDFFPESTMKVAPAVLDGPTPKLGERDPYRPALSAWVTAPDNPTFAKSMVNRTWALLFARGLVDPVDDLHEGNEPTHPELLDLLAAQFVASGFDLKQLYRTLALTKAYQRTSKPTDGNDKDVTRLSHMPMKVMTPEQLYDSLRAIPGGAATPEPAKGKANFAANRGTGNGRDGFVNFYLAGAEKPNQAEYEAGIPQALRLMNSRQTLGNNPAAVKAFVKPGATPAETVEALYLATLSRRPTPAEVTKLLAYLKEVGPGPTGFADILWTLTNASEFVLIR